MMTNSFALTNVTIYTGDTIIAGGVVSVLDGVINFVGQRRAIDRSAPVIDLRGLSIAPGFIDLQVNGGGDHLFNGVPSADTLRAIMDAHAQFGTTQLLASYITGAVEGMRQALDAVRTVRQTSDGCLGIHFEGPIISEQRLGVHDGSHTRRTFPSDLLDPGITTMVTLAPEEAAEGTIRDLVAAGVKVAIGHSDATYEQANRAIREGATCATHLYNAMSPLTGREPGVVGAFLSDPTAWASVIVDGHHCHFGSVAAAYRAKPRGKLFLVTDAMPPVGGIKDSYRLGSLDVTVHDGKCCTTDGTLAGSALDMASAVRNCVRELGIPTDDALRMASRYPAEYLGMSDRYGSIATGRIANMVIFDDNIRVSGTVRSGELTLA